MLHFAFVIIMYMVLEALLPDDIEYAQLLKHACAIHWLLDVLQQISTS